MEFLKFEPLLKQTIWGGDKIIPFKHLEKSLDQVGESWEVSGVKDNETVVANGEYKGWKLNDVLAEQKELLVGKENYARYGNLFPLLIKFIDARQQLSIPGAPQRRAGSAEGAAARQDRDVVCDEKRLHGLAAQRSEAADHTRSV